MDDDYTYIAERITELSAEGQYATLAAYLVENRRRIVRACRIASNLQRAGLRADLECGHIAPADEAVVTEAGAVLCPVCAHAEPQHG